MKKKNENLTLTSLEHLEVLIATPRSEIRKIANDIHSYYHPFDIHKINKLKWRHIDNPHEKLKRIQKKINTYLLQEESILLPKEMTGGITGRSIVNNASYHIGKECVAVIDINNCFPNISHADIYRIWKEKFRCGKRIARLLTILTTFEGRLPQGSPSSSLLCNFVLLPTFLEIKELANKNNLAASIFVDDIIISGSKKNTKESIQAVIKILQSHGYSISKGKLLVRPSGYQQKGTGVILNKKISLGNKEIRAIRHFILDIAKNKGSISASDVNLINGKISFAKTLNNNQGKKLAILAKKLLVAPIIDTGESKKNERRKCNNFNRKHIYVPLTPEVH